MNAANTINQGKSALKDSSTVLKLRASQLLKPNESVVMENSRLIHSKLNFLMAESFLFDREETALMKAVRQNHLECARLLLDEAGKQNARGQTAMMIAAKHGQADFVEILREREQLKTNKRKQTALIQAVAQNKIACVKLLKEEATFQDEGGLTALMWAAHQSQVDCVMELREAEHGM